MLSRTAVWVMIVTGLVVWLGESRVPGWLLGVALLSALTLGIAASRKQKRKERDFVAASWRIVTKRG